MFFSSSPTELGNGEYNRQEIDEAEEITRKYDTSREFFENEWFPKAYAIGVSWQDFWHMNPHIINLLIKGHNEKIKEKDYLAWLFGQYTLSAVYTAMEHSLSQAFGKKGKSEYTKDPILKTLKENEGLTEEEIQNKEIQKAILVEEMWIKEARKKGLPETVF